ncbi:hypothetical protein A5N17_00710 [Arthrobacter sp. D2]|nr:hypothetical protein AUT26_01270 [Arthrobacter sp. ATCC 21022]NKR12626.1 hypothetical protein [Arthrobacter sp. M5]NKR15942.1 hypothetical protein [Arthrobacter sp. M6]OEH59918.1 hypothetical protein A5N13_18840 [Arthrobacter sp. D4]OEH59936.1 hypothetical protein A5N17_00710 [Arthrobacter sp. D2]
MQTGAQHHCAKVRPMPAQPASRVPDEAHQPPDEPLWCSRCDSDQFLRVNSIQSHYPPAPNMVNVSYECAACRYIYSQLASVQKVAIIVNRPGSPQGMLKFGGQYLHCGEPMKTRSCELRRIEATLALGKGQPQSYEVHLNTRILGCKCGFRMEIPD